MPPFRGNPEYAELSLPITDRLCERILLLPNGASVAADDVDRICGLLATVIVNAADVRHRLAKLV